MMPVLGVFDPLCELFICVVVDFDFVIVNLILLFQMLDVNVLAGDDL